MKTRLRNLRSSPGMRKLVRETELSPDDFVMPYFVRPGKGVRQPISSSTEYWYCPGIELIGCRTPFPGRTKYGITKSSGDSSVSRTSFLIPGDERRFLSLVFII